MNIRLVVNNNMKQSIHDFRRMLPGLIISLALIAAILYFVDLQAMFNAIKAANYIILLVVFILAFLWMLVRAVVWRILLREKASFQDVFITLMEGYLLNNFLPFRLGEIGRAFLLSRKSPLKFAEILPTIIIERVTDLAFSAAILVAAVPFVVGAEGAAQLGLIVGGLVLAGLAAMMILARKREWALSQFQRLSQRWPFLQGSLGGILESFLIGLEVLADGWRSARFFGLMAFNWGIAILQYYLLCLAFFPMAQPVWGMFVLGAAAFGGAIPSLPGGVGTLEGAFGGALALLSGDQSTALAVALTARAINYFYSISIGMFGLTREGQTLSGIYQQLMNVQTRNDE